MCMSRNSYRSLLHHEPLDGSQFLPFPFFNVFHAFHHVWRICFAMWCLDAGPPRWRRVTPLLTHPQVSSSGKAVLQRSEEIIKHATLSKVRMKRTTYMVCGCLRMFAVCFWLLLKANRIRLHVGHTSALLASALIDMLKTDSFRMMRYGRENFGRDTPWQWNRPGWFRSHQPSYRINCVWRCVKLEAGHSKTPLYMSGKRAFRMRPRLNSFGGEYIFAQLRFKQIWKRSTT